MAIERTPEDRARFAADMERIAHDPENIVAHLNDSHGYTIPTDRTLPAWQLHTLRNEHDDKHGKPPVARVMNEASVRQWGLLPAAKVALYRALLLVPVGRLSDPEANMMATLAGDPDIQAVLDAAIRQEHRHAEHD